MSKLFIAGASLSTVFFLASSVPDIAAIGAGLVTGAAAYVGSHIGRWGCALAGGLTGGAIAGLLTQKQEAAHFVGEATGYASYWIGAAAGPIVGAVLCANSIMSDLGVDSASSITPPSTQPVLINNVDN